MAVKFDILDDGHIVRYTITDPWRYEDYKVFEAEDIAHRNSVNHKVHNLTVANLRPNTAGIVKTRNSPALTHPNAGHIAIVGTGAQIRFIAEMILKLARFERAQFFDTEEQALEYLRGIIQAEK
jgi:hypothetical protein